MDWRKTLKDASAIVGALSIIGGGAFGIFKLTERMHSDKQHVIEAEEFFNTYDEAKAYGEYIMDSIEEAHTQEWRRKQQILNDEQENKLNRLDSLIRLNVRLTDETLKAYKSAH